MGAARRISAAIAVVGCHALIAVIILSGYRRHSAPSALSESLLLITLPREILPPRRPAINEHNTQLSVPSSAPVAPPPAAQEPITSPPVDWSAEAASVAQQTLQRQTGSPHRTFGGWSREGVVERSGTDLAPGDTERFDDGEVRTWVNAHCYFTNRAPPEIPSGVPGAPSVWGKTTEVCQRSPRVPARRPAPGSTPALP